MEDLWILLTKIGEKQIVWLLSDDKRTPAILGFVLLRQVDAMLEYTIFKLLCGYYLICYVVVAPQQDLRGTVKRPPKPLKHGSAPLVHTLQ